MKEEEEEEEEEEDKKIHFLLLLRTPRICKERTRLDQGLIIAMAGLSS